MARSTARRTAPRTALWTDLPAVVLPRAPETLLKRLPPSARAATASGERRPIHLAAPPLVTALADFFAEEPATERLALLTGSVWSLLPTRQVLVEITSSCPVPAATATPVRVAMSASDWAGLWPTLARHPEEQIVGWAHSHPGGALFFSLTDRETQAAWFAQPWSLALVFAPETRNFAAFSGPHAESTGLFLG